MKEEAGLKGIKLYLREKNKYIMEEKTLEDFLKKCSDIQVIYEKKMFEEGAYFNIFSILGLNSREVRLHSTFIAELLNPKGTHSLGQIFLEKFIELLKQEIKNNESLNDFLIDKASIEVEKSIGTINEDYTEGGRIDIFLTDNQSNHIIIENKIYASDQPKQLERYNNYSKRNSKNRLILYLTLEGKESIEKIEHKAISYKKFILNWLRGCMNLIEDDTKINSFKKNKISETISQYYDIIENYLTPSNQNEMTEQIKNLLKENGNVFKVIPEIKKAHESLIEKIRSNFWEEIGGKYPWRKDIFKFKNETVIKSEINDEGGFYYGFLFENEIQNLDSELVTLVFNKAKMKNEKFDITKDNKIWIYGIPKVDFNDLDWVYKMSSEKERERFITEEIFPDFENAKNLILEVAKEINQ